MNVLHDILALLALALVALAPGGGVVVLLGLHRRLLAELVVPAALVATVVLASPVVVLQLGLHVRGSTMVWAWGALCLIGAVLVVRAAWIGPLRLPWKPTLWVAALSGLAAFVVGGLLDGDALYHAMYAERLAQLPDPGFATSQMFIDGSPHAGYLVPAWHFLVAQASLVAHVPVLEVMRAGSGLTALVAVLAFAGLGRAVLGGSAVVGTLGGLGYVFVDLLRPGSVPMWGASVGMWPGSVAIWIAVPVILACWLDDEPREHRGSLTLLALACAALGVLHVTYVLTLAWLGLGWLVAVGVAWVFTGRSRTAVGVRGAIWPPVVAVAASGCTLAAYTVLSGRVLATSDAVSTGAGAADRSFFEPLLAGGDSLRVAPHVFFAVGVLGVLGLIGASGAGILRRSRAGAAIAATTGVVIAVSQVEPVTKAVAHVAGLSHVTRLPQVIPLELGVGVVLVAVALAIDFAFTSTAPRARRAVFELLLGAGVIAVLAAARAWPPIAKRFAHPKVDHTTAALTLVVAAVLVVVSVVLWARVSRRGIHAEFAGPTTRGAVIALILLFAATFPATDGAGKDMQQRAKELRHSFEARDGVAQLPAPLIDRIEALPDRSVVLSLPLLSQPVPALAPVYVVAYPKIHTADTKRNERELRIRSSRAVGSMTAPTDEARLQRLGQSRADFIFVPKGSPGGAFIRRHPEVFRNVRTYGWLIAADVDPAPSTAKSTL